MKSVILVFVSLLIYFSASSQFSISTLDSIRKRVNEIDATIDHYEKLFYNDVKLKKDSMDIYPSEGSELYTISKIDLIKYFDDIELIKIVIILNGTHENLQSEYYFQENHLIFVRKNKIIFHKSKYHKDFDESKYSSSNNQFYFIKGKLEKWVVKNGKVKLKVENDMNPNFLKNESLILNDSELYRNH
jgi:hypothetical protein